MTFDELYRKILEILPNATMGEDNEGQLVISTGLWEQDGGVLVEYGDRESEES